jgi:hypothetical protein
MDQKPTRSVSDIRRPASSAPTDLTKVEPQPKPRRQAPPTNLRSPQPAAQPVVAPRPQPPAQPAQPAAVAPAKPKKRRRWPKVIAVIFLILACLAGIAAYFVYVGAIELA